MFFPFSIIILIIFIIKNSNCLPTKSFVVLRDEEVTGDKEVYKNKDLNEQKKFMLKCPKTSKNISSIEWSHNDQLLFSINFTQDGTPQVLKNNSKWLIKARVWHSIDGKLSMILTAKNGRIKVEIEMETLKNLKEERRQWMVLRLNKINIKEDRGVWKCQIYVKDENNRGRLKFEGESRKLIEDDRPNEEFSRRERQTQHQNKLYAFWVYPEEENNFKNDEFRTFGFSKTDGNYAIFERSVPSIGSKKLQQTSNDYKIEYIRNSKKLIKLFENNQNTWKWRRSSRTNSAAKNCGNVNLKLFNKKEILILFIIIMLNIFN